MATKAKYVFGDVVFGPLGFADDVNAEIDRPAVIISSQAFNDSRLDVIVMEITSRLHQAKHFGAFEVVDWQASGLKVRSVIKPLIFSIMQDRIKAKWGHLDPSTMRALKNTLPKIFGFRVAPTSP